MRKIISSLLLILFFASLFVAAAQRKAPNHTSAPEVLAQFTIEKNAKEILLPVKLDGKEYLFNLDTGCSVTLFDISLKDKLRNSKGIVKGKTPGGPIEVELFDAPEAFLGPLNLKDCRTVAVVHLEPVSTALGRKRHGVIGMNFLKKYVVQIDFDKGIVSFLKSKPDRGIFSFLWPSKNKHPDWGERVSVKYESRSGIPHIKAKVDGTKVDFTIDTGYVHLIGRPNLPVSDSTGQLESNIFKKLRSKIHFEPKQATQITGKGKATLDFGKTAAVSRFSIGALEYKDAVFHESGESVLGIPFLSRHLVTFDFPNRKIYLKKGKYFDRPSALWLSPNDLGFVLRRNKDSIFVSSVDPNSPAYKKGIRQNDIILKLHDKNVASYSLTELLPLLSSQPDRENLVITIKRGDDIMQLSFALKKSYDTRVGSDGPLPLDVQ